MTTDRTTDKTTGRATERPEDLPEAILEVAAVWRARLRDAETDPTESATRPAEFGRWLRADPRHARAYEATERLWRALETPAQRVLSEQPMASAGGRRTRRRLSPAILPTAWRAGAIAACLSIFFAVGIVGRDEILLRHHGDHVTAVGERAPVTLSDGSTITLNTSSAIAIDFGPDRRRVRLFKGQAWFDVSRDARRPFHVETPHGAIRVTGTRFDVRLDDDTAVVSLAEGRVAFPAAAGEDAKSSVTLQPGWQARLSDAGVSNAVPFDPSAVTAWLRGRIVFYDAPLKSVVSELNRYRTGRIVIIDSELEALRVSGVFSTDDGEKALAAIADTLAIGVTRLTDFLVLLH